MHTITMLILAGAIQVSGQPAGPWLHIRVEEPKQQRKVAVNLPMSVVDVGLRQAQDKPFWTRHFEFKRDHHALGDLTVSDLRKMWAELKTTGDAELVTVEEKDKKVRIAREGGVVLIRVEKDSGSQNVKIDVPTQVVDALLSGEGNELNVKAALAEIQKRRGDIVKVEDNGKSVRIWIDEATK